MREQKPCATQHTPRAPWRPVHLLRRRLRWRHLRRRDGSHVAIVWRVDASAAGRLRIRVLCLHILLLMVLVVLLVVVMLLHAVCGHVPAAHL